MARAKPVIGGDKKRKKPVRHRGSRTTPATEAAKQRFDESLVREGRRAKAKRAAAAAAKRRKKRKKK